MATTTNYSWTTPDDTALVKDGAAAIRSLGTAIDTTVFTNAGAAINKTIVDAKGDLIVASGADAVARLAVGTNDYVLTADSVATNGVKWAALPASGGMTLLSTTTLSGTETTISSISGSYKNLFILWNKVYASGNADFQVRFNSDTGSNYLESLIALNTYEASCSENQSRFRAGGVSSNSGDQTAFNGNLSIYRYTEGDSKFCFGMTNGKYSSTIAPWFFFCNYDSSTAISSITFRTGSAVTFSGGTVYIYGVS